MGTPGRPRASDLRTDLKQADEQVPLQFLLGRLKLQRQRFGQNLGLSPGTVTSFMSGRTQAPPRPFLVKAAQYACPETTHPIYLPNIVHHPELFAKDRITRPRKQRWEDRRVAAISDIRRGMKRLPGAPVPAWVTVDRMAATFDIVDITKFETYVRNTLCWIPQKDDRFYPFCHAYRGNGFHLSFQPRGKRDRLDPETGELLPPSFARIDLHARAMSIPGFARLIIGQYVLPFLEPNSLEVTLLDIAVDYAMDSWPLLHHDRRSRKSEVWRPNQPWLQNAASNMTFGSRNGERFLRTYNKSIERVDRLLERDPGFCNRAEDEVLNLWPEEEPVIGTPEPDAEDLLLELRHTQEVADHFPDHVRKHPNIHRVEASIRPRRSRGHVPFDRRPHGLVLRILQKIDPFEGHHLVHLGVADTESFWTPAMMFARIEGTSAVVEELRSQAKGKKRRQLSKAITDAFLTQIQKLADRTDEVGLQQPGGLIQQNAALLQQVLDNIFDLRTTASLMPEKAQHAGSESKVLPPDPYEWDVNGSEKSGRSWPLLRGAKSPLGGLRQQSQVTMIAAVACFWRAATSFGLQKDPQPPVGQPLRQTQGFLELILRKPGSVKRRSRRLRWLQHLLRSPPSAAARWRTAAVATAPGRTRATEVGGKNGELGQFQPVRDGARVARDHRAGHDV